MADAGVLAALVAWSPFPAAPTGPFLAADAVGEWLLWGGLAALFTALYIGVYVWMRRPKFGEGKPQTPPSRAHPDGRDEPEDNG